MTKPANKLLIHDLLVDDDLFVEIRAAAAKEGPRMLTETIRRRLRAAPVLAEALEATQAWIAAQVTASGNDPAQYEVVRQARAALATLKGE